MIRKFNYTERRRIPKADAVIRLVAGGADTAFDADLSLVGLGLPSDAHVYVEAYFKGTVMRFDYGSIGVIEPPTDRRLLRFPQPDLAYFRVKVVAESDRRGLLLASCDRLMPLVAKEGRSNRQTIFRVQTMRMDSEIWRLRFDDEGPVLELNDDFGSIKETARSDAGFAALVYPSLVRQVLNHVLLEEKHDDPDTEDDWRALWLRFGKGLVKERPPQHDDEESVKEWIDKVVARFSHRNKFLINYRRALRREPEG
jgi:hypothetical protein